MAVSTGAALLGAAVVGAGASAYSSSKASSAASSQAAAASQATAEQLAFQKQQYDDWKNVFGDVQNTLSNYYKTLTPEVISAANIQALNEQYTQARTNLDQTLAQRGLSTSGAAVQGNVQLEQARATAAASAKANAPLQAAQEKMNFLRAGLGLEGSMISGVSNAYANQANTALGLSGQYNQLASQAGAGVGQALGAGLSAYARYNALDAGTPQISNTALGASSNFPLTSAYFS